MLLFLFSFHYRQCPTLSFPILSIKVQSESLMRPPTLITVNLPLRGKTFSAEPSPWPLAPSYISSAASSFWWCRSCRKRLTHFTYWRNPRGSDSKQQINEQKHTRGDDLSRTMNRNSGTPKFSDGHVEILPCMSPSLTLLKCAQRTKDKDLNAFTLICHYVFNGATWPVCTWRTAEALRLVEGVGSLLLCLVDWRHALCDPGRAFFFFFFLNG